MWEIWKKLHLGFKKFLHFQVSFSTMGARDSHIVKMESLIEPQFLTFQSIMQMKYSTESACLSSSTERFNHLA